MTTRYPQLVDLQALVGQVLGVSDWQTVDQMGIDAFAAATGDSQWIHTDPTRAAAGPYGAAIAHGFLTLSLMPRLAVSAYGIDDVRMSLNYGLNRVRFPAVLPAGSRVRAHFKLCDYLAIDGGAQLVIEMSVEREAHAKPVCVAESVLRHFV